MGNLETKILSFLDKKDKEYNANLDAYNLQANSYNQAIKDIKKEIKEINKSINMGKSAEYFLAIREELLNTHNQVTEGELSNLDGLIEMRKAKQQSELILEDVKRFEDERLNEISQEAESYNGKYCGLDIKMVNGRKLYNFSHISEIKEIEDKAKQEKDRFQKAFEAYQKGLIQTTEVDGVLHWIDDNGELHLFPELNHGKSFLQIKQSR